MVVTLKVLDEDEMVTEENQRRGPVRDGGYGLPNSLTHKGQEIE